MMHCYAAEQRFVGDTVDAVHLSAMPGDAQSIEQVPLAAICRRHRLDARTRLLRRRPQGPQPEERRRRMV